MASIVYSYIDPSGGGDFTTLDNWWVARRGDIVSRDTIEVARMRGSTIHQTAVSMFAGQATVDADHYFVVEAEPGLWDHAGVFHRKRSYLRLTTGFLIEVGYTRVGEGMCIYPNLDAGNPIPVLIRNVAGDTPIIVNRAIIHKYAGPAIRIENCAGASGHAIKSTVLLNATGNSDGVVVDGAASKAVVYNCTIVMDQRCLYALNGGTIESQNNYLGGHTASVCYSGAGVSKGSKDITWNGEAIDPLRRNVDFMSRSVFYFGNGGCPGYHEGQTGISDWHIPATSPLLGAGEDLSAVPALFRPAKGLDNQDRVAPWDVGADEYTFLTHVESHVGPGQAYATLVAWEAARRGNHATRNERETVYVHGAAGHLEMWEENWALSNAHRVVVCAAPGEGHLGRFRSDGAYLRRQTGGWNVNVVTCHVGGVTFGPGLVVDMDNDTGGNRAFEVGGESPAPIIVDRVYGRLTSASTGPFLRANVNLINYNKHWDLIGVVQYVDVLSCMFDGLRGNASRFVWDDVSTGKIRVYGCTAACGAASSALRLYHGGFEDDNYLCSNLNYANFLGTKGAHTATQNAEALTPGLQNVALDGTNFVDVSPLDPDLHILRTSVLRGAGVDLRSSGLLYDIDGRSRPAVPSIGADEPALEFLLEVYDGIELSDRNASLPAGLVHIVTSAAKRPSLLVLPGKRPSLRLDS